jgi:hypothetical protein
MPKVWFNSSSRDYEEHPYGGKVFASRALIRRQSLHPHPAIDDGADHRPALIGKREQRIGVDALEIKMTAEAFIVGECVSNVLLCDGVLGDCILVVAHQEHAAQVMDQVLLGVRVITEFLGGMRIAIFSRKVTQVLWCDYSTAK